ncbi:MAG: GNAT family N-acetyltransferase [Chloroflexi bacterium]|nr:GNAT family N-acetyltransferase [Chloroflexota bacterium]MBP8058869.1 GNAT family N-acetyltransferase [Chloroflexota bacterium]
MPILTTKRLVLRHLTVDDAPFILELLNEPSFIQNIGDRGVHSLDDARAYLQNGPLASYERHGFGLYCVELQASGAAIGMCGLIRRDTLPDVDVGYAFFPRYWGQGYAFEAAAAALTYGRDYLGLPRVIAIVSPGNTASINVLQKLGLKFDRMISWSEDGTELKVFA